MVYLAGDARGPANDDRVLELRELAETRHAWRHERRAVVLELARWLQPGEGVCELRAGQDDDDAVVVIVSDRRVLIGRRPDRSAPIAVEAIGLDDVVSVETDDAVAGDVRIAWPTGFTEVHRLSGTDAAVVVAAVRQRMRSKQRDVLRRRRDRKPQHDFEVLDSLRHAGVLTLDEVAVIREQLIRDIAVRSERADADAADTVRRPSAA